MLHAVSIWEKKLSFDAGYFANQGGLVRIDILYFDDLNLRIPDGNEAGAQVFGGTFIVNDVSSKFAKGFTDDMTGKITDHRQHFKYC